MAFFPFKVDIFASDALGQADSHPALISTAKDSESYELLIIFYEIKFWMLTFFVWFVALNMPSVNSIDYPSLIYIRPSQSHKHIVSFPV